MRGSRVIFRHACSGRAGGPIIGVNEGCISNSRGGTLLIDLLRSGVLGGSRLLVGRRSVVGRPEVGEIER